MARIPVSVSSDDFFEGSGAPGIMGPIKGECGGWVVYFPNRVPCICDSFKDAVGLMNELLQSDEEV